MANLKTATWATVWMPEEWGDEAEVYLRRAYEKGVKDGQNSVRDPIKKALGYVEADQVSSWD